MTFIDKPLGCPHDWHEKEIVCGEAKKPIKGLTERKCCICNAEQFIDNR